jgi:hypothetical protein
LPLTGLSLPAVSAFDPPVAGEGSLDPMGLAAISDRLADLMIPGVRARMNRVRFVTAMAVGALVCEPLADEASADEVSSPAICFEWLVVEALVRRIDPSGRPAGIPGSFKAQTVLLLGQRLSASTYLKAPTVFGFNGVYKPFAVDARVVDSQLAPGAGCVELVRAWERDHDLAGFAGATSGTEGGRLRRRLTEEVRGALGSGRCTAAPGSALFGRLAAALRPDGLVPGGAERAVLRGLILAGEHAYRAELAQLVSTVDEAFSEGETLDLVRGRSSPGLRGLIDAVTGYERLAAAVDTAFRTLCAISFSLGTQPLTPATAADHPTLVRCAAELPDRYRQAAAHVGLVVDDIGLEQRLGEFAVPRGPAELVDLLLDHHTRTQLAKPPAGRRPWFEPLRDGWVVRTPYASPEQPALDRFVHPVRVNPLRQFMRETS